MPAPWIFNATGLCIGMVAAVLMYYFPPRVLLYSDKGEPAINFVSAATESGKRRGKWQSWLSKIAPWILAFGFFLQLVATIPWNAN